MLNEEEDGEEEEEDECKGDQIARKGVRNIENQYTLKESKRKESHDSYKKGRS